MPNISTENGFVIDNEQPTAKGVGWEVGVVHVAFKWKRKKSSMGRILLSTPVLDEGSASHAF